MASASMNVLPIATISVSSSDSATQESFGALRRSSTRRLADCRESGISSVVDAMNSPLVEKLPKYRGQRLYDKLPKKATKFCPLVLGVCGCCFSFKYLQGVSHANKMVTSIGSILGRDHWSFLCWLTLPTTRQPKPRKGLPVFCPPSPSVLHTSAACQRSAHTTG